MFCSGCMWGCFQVFVGDVYDPVVMSDDRRLFHLDGSNSVYNLPQRLNINRIQSGAETINRKITGHFAAKYIKTSQATAFSSAQL